MALAQLADEMQGGTPEWDNLRINEYHYFDLDISEEDSAEGDAQEGDAPEADRPTEGEAL